MQGSRRCFLMSVVALMIFNASAEYETMMLSMAAHHLIDLNAVHDPPATLTVSCAEGPVDQAKFDTALQALHNFWYPRARRLFGELMEKTPSCPMYAWAYLLAHWSPLWEPPTFEERLELGQLLQRAKAQATTVDSFEDALLKGIEILFPRQGSRSGYHDQVIAFSNYNDVLADHCLVHYVSTSLHSLRWGPQPTSLEVECGRMDQVVEAAALAGLSALAEGYSILEDSTADPREGVLLLDREFLRMEAARQLNPRHPGILHFMVHAKDFPSKAKDALVVAHDYSQCADATPHAYHMPSHIYQRLGMWEDSVAADVMAMYAAVKDAIDTHEMGTNDEYMHSLDYLVAAHLNRGRDGIARIAATEMRTIDVVSPFPTRGALYSLMSAPARYLMETEAWHIAAHYDLPATFYPFQDKGRLWARIHTRYIRAVGASMCVLLSGKEGSNGTTRFSSDPDTYAHYGEGIEKAIGMLNRDYPFVDYHSFSSDPKNPVRDVLCDSATPLDVRREAAIIEQLWRQALQSEEMVSAGVLWKVTAEVQVMAVQGWAACAEGNWLRCVRTLYDAAVLEDKYEKPSVKPGVLFPAREQYALALLHLSARYPAARSYVGRSASEIPVFVQSLLEARDWILATTLHQHHELEEEEAFVTPDTAMLHLWSSYEAELCAVSYAHWTISLQHAPDRVRPMFYAGIAAACARDVGAAVGKFQAVVALMDACVPPEPQAVVVGSAADEDKEAICSGNGVRQREQVLGYQSSRRLWRRWPLATPIEVEKTLTRQAIPNEHGVVNVQKGKPLQNVGCPFLEYNVSVFHKHGSEQPTSNTVFQEADLRLSDAEVLHQVWSRAMTDPLWQTLIASTSNRLVYPPCTEISERSVGTVGHQASPDQCASGDAPMVANWWERLPKKAHQLKHCTRNMHPLSLPGDGIAYGGPSSSCGREPRREAMLEFSKRYVAIFEQLVKTGVALSGDVVMMPWLMGVGVGGALLLFGICVGVMGDRGMKKVLKQE